MPLGREWSQTGKLLKMTDKHTVEHSNTACLGVYWAVCDAYVAHTNIAKSINMIDRNDLDL